MSQQIPKLTLECRNTEVPYGSPATPIKGSSGKSQGNRVARRLCLPDATHLSLANTTFVGKQHEELQKQRQIQTAPVRRSKRIATRNVAQEIAQDRTLNEQQSIKIPSVQNGLPLSAVNRDDQGDHELYLPSYRLLSFYPSHMVLGENTIAPCTVKISKLSGDVHSRAQSIISPCSAVVDVLRADIQGKDASSAMSQLLEEATELTNSFQRGETTMDKYNCIHPTPSTSMNNIIAIKNVTSSANHRCSGTISCPTMIATTISANNDHNDGLHYGITSCRKRKLETEDNDDTIRKLENVVKRYRTVTVNLVD